MLSGLSADFVKNGCDVRRQVRTINTSAAYWRSSTPAAGSPPDAKYYSAYVPRRLPAEVLLDGISSVTGVPTDFAWYPTGTRALQLPDAQVASYFLSAFGRPQRVQTCSCERQEEPNVAQALHLSNGDTINGKLRAPGGTVERLAKEGLSGSELLDRLYLTALGRTPRPAEREKVLTALHLAPDARVTEREPIEDLLSALLMSNEFLFNH
jgi:hypothetical protein